MVERDVLALEARHVKGSLVAFPFLLFPSSLVVTDFCCKQQISTRGAHSGA